MLASYRAMGTDEWDAVPLESSRLTLEPLRVDHAEEMAPLLADAELYAFTEGEPPTLEELRARYVRQVPGRSPDGVESWLNWIVRRRDDGQAVGFVQAAHLTRPAPARPAHRRPGLGAGHPLPGSRLRPRGGRGPDRVAAEHGRAAAGRLHRRRAHRVDGGRAGARPGADRRPGRRRGRVGAAHRVWVTLGEPAVSGRRSRAVVLITPAAPGHHGGHLEGVIEHDQVSAVTRGDRADRCLEAQDTSRIGGGGRRRLLDAEAAVVHRAAQGLAHRQRASGERPGARQAGLALVHAHLLTAEHEGAVADAAGVDRVGDEHGAGDHLRHQSDQRGVEVAAVVDELTRDIGLQGGSHQARRAVVQRRHGVEEMGGVVGAGADRGRRLFKGGVGVPHGHDHAPPAQRCDERDRSVELGGKRHHSQPAAGRGDQAVQHRAIRGDDVRRVLGPAAGGGEERALQVGSEHVAARRGPAADELGRPRTAARRDRPPARS